ncbi:DUF488 domain-containing protein [Asticcacaulis sp. BYS171W]|uniref:DUF488 domain-containing protein n=1 Tax=Asticcacaulis aquaticus TaxID=2984212 RepID=A0ABT5HUN8_9CAUL|nr:DUF488 domain-containing protein [Asticcacaulis aquaticus]MDC7683786.1 DUF488 domain-containing protein [Asticcacaulis aquaticus]
MGVPLYTIGFTQTTAAHFFTRLKTAGVTKVIDIRLHNSSQLAGFAKSEDLAWFLKSLGGIDYAHHPLLAPTDDILKAFKKEKGDWGQFQSRFLNLMTERKVETRFKAEDFDGACLLCSEATPHHCHRRLLSEYLNDKWGQTLKVTHL